jgi:multimeric flavodoxin WrbA
MQITTLLGSAKKKGNTATVLSWVEKELESLGHNVDRIYLNKKTIKGNTSPISQTTLLFSRRIWTQL